MEALSNWPKIRRGHAINRSEQLLSNVHSKALLPVPAKLVHGVGSYALLSHEIDTDWLRTAVQMRVRSPKDPCLLSDDLLVSYALARAGTMLQLVANSALSHQNLLFHPIAQRVNGLHNTAGFFQQFYHQLIAPPRPLQYIEARLQHCLLTLD
jgi:hypothetical protein